MHILYNITGLRATSLSVFGNLQLILSYRARMGNTIGQSAEYYFLERLPMHLSISDLLICRRVTFLTIYYIKKKRHLETSLSSHSRS